MFLIRHCRRLTAYIGCYGVFQLKDATGFILGSLRTLCIQVDLATKLYPGVAIAPIILGTMGGCAGKFFLDFTRSFMGLQAGPDESEFIHPTFIWRSSLLGALVYYIAVHIMQAVSSEYGLAVLRISLVTQDSLLLR